MGERISTFVEQVNGPLLLVHVRDDIIFSVLDAIFAAMNFVHYALTTNLKLEDHIKFSIDQFIAKPRCLRPQTTEPLATPHFKLPSQTSRQAGRFSKGW